MEINQDFYDLEYYISMEYRFYSSAHSSKFKNLLKLLGDIRGKKILDIGCGGGIFANEMVKLGADVIGIDYSEAGIKLAKERFPNIEFKVASIYEINPSIGEFDIVIMADTIEHLNSPELAIDKVKKMLKSGGNLLISTDREVPKIYNRFYRLSKDGRAYLLIKKAEEYRRKFKNYHQSHINPTEPEKMREYLKDFTILKQTTYPLVSVPIRDLFFKGDHYAILAKI